MSTIKVKGVVESVEDVSRIAGNFESVTVAEDNGAETTILGKILEIHHKSGAQKTKGYKLVHEDGREETFYGAESPNLYTKDESGAKVPRPMPEGASIRPVDSGRGGTA